MTTQICYKFNCNCTHNHECSIEERELHLKTMNEITESKKDTDSSPKVQSKQNLRRFENDSGFYHRLKKRLRKLDY